MSEDDKLQAFVDPLIILKDTITRGKIDEIIKLGDEFHFEFYNCALNVNTPTRCRNRRGESLNLDDLYLFITASKNKKYTMKLAQDNGLKFINILEKKNIFEFLNEFIEKTQDSGIPSTYSIEDLGKYECINTEFSLQPCRILDNSKKIINLNYPWVEYKIKTDIESINEKNSENIINSKVVNSIQLKNRDEMFVKRKVNLISQIYPINIDYICQGIDMYTRINSLLTFMNEPTKGESKKRSTESSSYIQNNAENIKLKDGRRSNTADFGKRGSESSINTSNTSKPRNIPKSINSQQRSTLLAYLNSNNLNPIILVPPSSKSPITLSNIIQFLRDKEFVDPNLAKRNFVGNEQTVTLSFGSGTTVQKVTFRILESTLNFRKRDWYSLIAVFLTGAEWQLQSFPFKTIQDIFTMVKGYHVTYDSEPIPDNIRKWNVDVVRINRTNRHNDLSVWFQFMESIESVLASSRDHSKLDRSKL
ncbi:RNA pol II accessory factor, Cdc73 family protein [Cryptosporidium meleagridis]|uniref:RNA pol II accessory factor, Cdc73 family protein n=1 Tax=Cryptosporidium meleagridis TaxID=93969 RepID=A0A2P4YX33_9CRYT|nr:RNA pol II accessory factor, Cdc73 family protein [Cryptosporidium meleagridis]